MAIAKMNKVWIIGMHGKEKETIRQIMKEGTIELKDTTYLAEAEEWKDTLTKQECSEEIATNTKKLTQIEQAIKSIKTIHQIKHSLFAPKKEYQEITKEQAKESMEKVLEINKSVEEIEKLKNKVKVLQEKNKEILPWKELKLDIQDIPQEKIKVQFGILPGKTNINAVEKRWQEEKIKASIVIARKDKDKIYVAIVTYQEGQVTIKRELNSLKFISIAIEEGIQPSKIIEQTQQEIKNSEHKIEEITKSIPREEVEELENLYDYYVIQKEIAIAQKNIVQTKHTFYLEGWIPEGKKLPPKEGYVVQTAKPEEDEPYPVLVENSSLVTPFQSITNMYSCPNQKELDPNPIMSAFFIFFFGMMLSDAGYGFILTIACIAILKIKKYKKGEGSLVKILTFSGISTIIWGLLFGSFFGDLVPLTPVINPLTDVMALMGLSLLLGVVHIYAGMMMKAITLIKEKKILDAIFDVFLWYIFLTGIFLSIIPVVAGDIGIFAEVGNYLAIGGAIALVLTQGRKEKNIFKKLLKGIASLYDLTSYFADVLSYSRLMALCLSTGVIAQVVNLLGGIAGPIPAIFIGLIGHTINLANSALGSYVHTSRLQYVEFFGKFYEGGGKRFTPLTNNLKYTRI